MRKQLLASALAVFAVAAFAGENSKPTLQTSVTNATIKKAAVFPTKSNQSVASRASRALVKFPLSSAGNLLSVLNSNCNQLYVEDSINSVVFIHRNDETAACCNQPGSNVAQYRFDVSKDGGVNWNANIGPVNPKADNVNINGRFPQAVIYRKPGQLNADSAYMVYSGTWHDGANGSWEGEYRGVSQLTGNPATFTDSNEVVNGGRVAVAGGLTQGIPGFFINVNTSSNTSFASTALSKTLGLLIQKGQWNAATRNVDWTLDDKQFTIEDVVSGSQQFSAIGSPVAGFDPSGKYGWVAVDADITIDGRYTFSPVLFKSVDYGATWTGPIEVKLDSLKGMFESPEIINSQTGSPYDVAKTVIGGLDISVDSAGNPHIAMVVGVARADEATYSYFPNAGLAMYDITYKTGGLCGDWKANFIAQVFSVSAEYTQAFGADPAYSDNNRVQSARNADGSKIFMFWNDTDESIASQQSGDANVSPNLFGIGIDIANGMTTSIKNFTEGDSLFGGETPNSQPGTLYGSLFPVVSQNAFTKSASYNVPVVLTEPDYNNQGSGSKNGSNPARFYYCQNIDFAFNEFTTPIDVDAPVITLNGADTVIVAKDSVFTDPGASAFDCVDGVVTVFNSSTVQTAVPGYYTVTYTAKDSAGNIDTAVRVVLVAAKPIALFSAAKFAGNKYVFRDTSLYFPTSRLWSFGDGTGSTLQNPPAKTYAAAGNKTICLTVSNSFGQDSICKTIEMFLSIKEAEIASSIAVFPTSGNGNLNLTIGSPVNEVLNITVLDIRGAVVSTTEKLAANTTNKSLNYTNLESGAYQLKIGNDKLGYAVKPFIINK